VEALRTEMVWGRRTSAVWWVQYVERIRGMLGIFIIKVVSLDKWIVRGRRRRVFYGSIGCDI
jgi:hypothetical protein